MARLRHAPSTSVEQTTTQRTRAALKDKTNTTQLERVGDAIEDPVEDLVKPARSSRRPGPTSTQNDTNLVMAGGLGLPESKVASATSSDPATSAEDAPESSESAAMKPKANRRPPRTARKIVQSEAESKILKDMKERMQATTGNQTTGITRRPPAAARSSARKSKSTPASKHALNARSNFSSSPSLPVLDESIAVQSQQASVAQPTSIARTRTTPMGDTSIAALRNFKRRPRQPSMLQMVQQRTASARPSMNNSTAVEVPSALDIEDVDYDDDDEEDFAPDAEGTPAYLRTKVLSSQPIESVRSNRSVNVFSTSKSKVSRKRKSDDAELDLSTAAPSASQMKRRKSRASPDDIQVINSSPSSTSIASSPSIPREPSLGVEVAVPSTEQESHEPRRARRHIRDAEDSPNDTMAEPASSSPVPSKDDVDVMADPLTQRSPPSKPREAAKTKTRAKPMTTAKLQSLLPKRRKRLPPRERKSEYDFEASSSDDQQDPSEDDEDEDEGPRARSRRPTKTPAPTRRKMTATATQTRPSTAPARKSTLQSTRKTSTAAQHPPPSTTRPKPKPTPAPSKLKPTPRTSKTYTRTTTMTTTSDKENHRHNSTAKANQHEDEDETFSILSDTDPSALPDTSISMIEAAQSAELEAARRKFAEVDEWDMEFESVSVGEEEEEGRRSSQNWR